MKTAFFVLLFAVAAALGCSGGRHIYMKNTTGNPAQIIFTLNEDSLDNNPFLISNSDVLKFDLNPPKSSVIKMSFKEGGWSLKEVEKLAGHLKSLEIISATEHLRMDSLPQIRDYLLARRKGIGGMRIELLVSK